jgi:hypothetical protein
MTVPDRGFVDKIARNLLHYKIVMAQKWFSRGITLGRLSTVRKMYNKDDGKNIFPYVRHKGVVYNYTYFGLAPEWLRDEYEKRRHEIEEEMRQRSIEEYEEQGKESGGKGEGISQSKQISDKVFAVAEQIALGYTQKEACAMFDLDPKTYRKHAEQSNLPLPKSSKRKRTGDASY